MHFGRRLPPRAWLHGLDDERRARLRVLATRFLHEKTIPDR
jgi:hypothetical protein